MHFSIHGESLIRLPVSTAEAYGAKTIRWRTSLTRWRFLEERAGGEAVRRLHGEEDDGGGEGGR